MTFLTEQKVTWSRRSVLGLAAGALALAAAPRAFASPSIVTGAGDIRRVNISNPRTGERVDTVYWIEGEYIPEAKAEIDFILRDWRENLMIDYDLRTVDILSAVYRLLETGEPVSVVSGYRSPVTNALLRRSSRGVAKDSYHTKGMAIDLQMKGRSPTQIRRAARNIGAGGVGGYRSFTHIDSGPARAWGRA